MINRNLDYEKLFNELVDFTFSYVKNHNLRSAVLGISGGIDSTVVAAILYEVTKKHDNWFNTLSDKDIRKFNVLPFVFYGYSLPTKTTNGDEFHTSTIVGNAFCKYHDMHLPSFFTEEIEDCANFVSNFCGVVGTLGNDAFRTGNIKSRLRMIYLYDHAKKHNGFVVGTDNWTEKLLGFSTIGGDALADYMPIQYLWKTEVYGLANYLLEKYKKEENWAAVHALAESIKLTPQDGLGISSSDMEQIGAKNYFDVDEILYEFVQCVGYNKNYTPGSVNTEFDKNVYPKLVKKFGNDVVQKVLNRYLNNFKLNLPIEFINDDIKQ